MPLPEKLLYISIGTIVGACARYLLSNYVAKQAFSAFPLGTLLINVTGSMLLGFFLILATEKLFVGDRWRMLVAVGFCGSYTTFSSYAFESFALMEQGQWMQVTLNVIGSNLLCLASVAIGAALARWI
jgi:CrcB protein